MSKEEDIKKEYEDKLTRCHQEIQHVTKQLNQIIEERNELVKDRNQLMEERLSLIQNYKQQFERAERYNNN